MLFHGSTFENEHEVIDGNEYSECNFSGCTLIYRGGKIPMIENCRFRECTWEFRDAAERTLQFLQLIYAGMDEGGKVMVESTFNTIRG